MQMYYTIKPNFVEQYLNGAGFPQPFEVMSMCQRICEEYKEQDISFYVEGFSVMSGELKFKASIRYNNLSYAFIGEDESQ